MITGLQITLSNLMDLINPYQFRNLSSRALMITGHQITKVI